MKIYTTDMPNKGQNTSKEKKMRIFGEKSAVNKQKSIKSKQKNKQGRTITVCLAWLVLWQLLSMAVGSELLLPSPYASLCALARLAATGDFYRDIAWTMLRCVIAMLLSVAAGGIAAWFASQNGNVRSFLSLPVSFFKAVPVMAVIIYVILLVSSDWVAIIVCFIMCFPIVYTNLLSGLDSVSREYLELAKICRLTRRQTLRLIYFPSLRPSFNAALRLVCGLSWKAVIAAEVLSIPKFSLGYEMLNAKYYLETANLFAYIAVIVAVSILFEKVVCVLFCGEAKISLGIEEKEKVGSKAGKSSGSNAECAKSAEDLPPTIRFEHIYKSFEDKTVLSDISLELKSGAVTAIAAPSGRGKTTIARLIAGLETANSGSIGFYVQKAGESRNCESCCDIRLSYLFQEDRLLPWLNVYDNMALARIGERGGVKSCADSVLLDRDIRNIAEALELDDELFKLPDELSGGMKHRVALGRTFLAESNLMILDEPFRGLDGKLKERITDRLWDKVTEGKTVILISHNDDDCKKLAKEVISI